MLLQRAVEGLEESVRRLETAWAEFGARALERGGPVGAAAGSPDTDAPRPPGAGEAARDTGDEHPCRAVLDAVPANVAVLDACGRIVRVNAGWRRFGQANGAGEETIRGAGINYLEVCRAASGPFSEGAQECLEGLLAILEGRAAELEIEYPCHSPTVERWYLMRATSVPDMGGVAVSHIDITALKLAQRERDELLRREREALADAREANATKDQFLAVLSHELRNPLSPILAGISVLRRDLPDAERPRRTLEIMERNAKLQARLVNDLLDLSRFTRGTLALRCAPVTIDEAVRAAVQDQEPGAEAAGVALKTDLQAGLWVSGDLDRLQQVVTNLLANAIKFTPAGGEVRVTTRRADGKAHVVVEDTGIGIDQELLSRLFQMFQQGEVSGKRVSGLGIGLSLVRSLAEMHGGRVWAESGGAGMGSRFTVELPLIEAPRQPSLPERPAARAGRPQVLVIEDNADARTLLSEGLDDIGYQVTPAESGEEALQLLDRVRPDVILADIGLPGMDGYEFLRQARSTKGLAGIPAFAVTGYGEEEDVRRAHDAGYTGHFVKPVDVPALDSRMREGLGRPAPT